MLDAAEEVDEEDQDRDGDQEGADGQEQMRPIKPEGRIVIDDTSAHAAQTDEHHAKR